MEKYQEIIIRLTKTQKEGLLEASICYLRGVAYSQQSDLDNAKKWFKKRWKIDVKYFENGTSFIHSYFIKMNYISMLKKYEHVTEIQEARSELENKFRLSNNADILLSHVDEVTTNKASTMDSHCGPAWVGFGHTLAIESEHDQTITAYSTAAKLYPGSHLPTPFIVGYAQSVDPFKNAFKVAEEYGKQYGLILAMLSDSLVSCILLNHFSKK
ncbi:anaphase-promoting complex subunit cut9 [Gigaspora margarita]|uniref:Anaphase-promoting complex subunit cut9 n=1 Tax=Gigaspora margarita TaxID=4874 RepID=A0A8H4EJ57_GIGMA|nr:anaphase-promoting complex subunit cut9 [Gigaspora margarita]